jgi:hypothetical protein
MDGGRRDETAMLGRSTEHTSKSMCGIGGQTAGACLYCDSCVIVLLDTVQSALDQAINNPKNAANPPIHMRGKHGAEDRR